MKIYIIILGLTLQPYYATELPVDTNRSLKIKEGESNDEVQNNEKIKIPSKERTYIALHIDKLGTTRSDVVTIKDNIGNIVVNNTINIKGKDRVEIQITELSKFYRKGYTFNYGKHSEPIVEKEGQKVFNISTTKLKSGDKIGIKDRFGNSIFEITVTNH